MDEPLRPNAQPHASKFVAVSKPVVDRQPSNDADEELRQFRADVLRMAVYIEPSVTEIATDVPMNRAGRDLATIVDDLAEWAVAHQVPWEVVRYWCTQTSLVNVYVDRLRHLHSTHGPSTHLLSSDPSRTDQLSSEPYCVVLSNDGWICVRKSFVIYDSVYNRRLGHTVVHIRTRTRAPLSDDVRWVCVDATDPVVAVVKPPFVATATTANGGPNEDVSPRAGGSWWWTAVVVTAVVSVSGTMLMIQSTM